MKKKINDFLARLLNFKKIIKVEKVEVIKKRIIVKEPIYRKDLEEKRKFILKDGKVVGIGIVKEVYVNPLELRDEIIRLIRNAEKNIIISSPYVTNNKICEEIKKRKDIKIEILTGENKKNNKIKIEDCEKLCKKNSENGKKIHQKFCVIDEKYIILGTFNFSNHGEKNHEVAVEIIGGKSVVKLKKHFQKLMC